MLSSPETDKKQNNEKNTGAAWLQRLQTGLGLTRHRLGISFSKLIGSHDKIDEAVYEELETLLLTSDLGVSATQRLIKAVKAGAREKNLVQPSALLAELRQQLLILLAPLEVPLNIESSRPFIVMMVGVNGCGKTTSAGKLAHFFQAQGKSILFAAGDTFRAAAVAQLRVWGERNNVFVVAQESGDSAAVIFDAINAAVARGIDIVLADTAGRLPTQINLMEEIKKVKRVIGKAQDGAPHEVLLVLDANTGQNAIAQFKAFDDALGVTGLVLTKLDGTAKGGVIAAIADYKKIPLRFIGVGEQIDDLQPFRAEAFVNAIFDSN